MINQAPIVRYTASVSETFFPNSSEKDFFSRITIQSLQSLFLQSEIFFFTPRIPTQRNVPLVGLG